MRTRRMRRARDGYEDDFLLLEAPDWVMILALTPEKNILMVEQFRFGSNEFSWEPPGGVIDAGEVPEACATRELLEETGYAGDAPKPLGWLYPNPPLQKNRAFFFLIENCKKIAEPTPDITEDLHPREFSLDEAFAMARDGRIRHAMSLAAFFKLEPFLNSNP